MAVDSYTSTLLAKAMALSLIDSLSLPSGYHPLEGYKEPSQETMASILRLAKDLQAILGEAMDTTTAIFPHRISSAPARSTLPHHLWLKSARYDISNIRHRAKAIRLEVRPVADSLYDVTVMPQITGDAVQ